MNLTDFCREFGIGRTKAWEERKAGRLKVHYVGNRPRVGWDDAEAWFRSLPSNDDPDSGGDPA
jgi:hypothetical protein